MYNHIDFDHNEAANSSGPLLLTGHPNVALPYRIPRGFDMEEQDVSALYWEDIWGAWSKNIYILIGVMKIGGSVSSLSTTVSYFPSDRLHPVYAMISRDHETRRRLEKIELQRFQLTPSQGEVGHRPERRVSV